jgi:hypothetical protein
MIQRLFIEIEPLIEAFYMLKMGNCDHASLFEPLKDELLMAYPKATHIYQRIQNIENDFVIIDALNNPRLSHEYIRLVNDGLTRKRFSRQQLAGLWPETERPYERCMCLIDAIEVTRKQRNESNSHLSKNKMSEEVDRAKRLTCIESTAVDLSRLPSVIKPMISTKLYLKPKFSPKAKIKDLQSSLLIELEDNQLKLGEPIKKPEKAALFMNLNLTWIVHQILSESLEINCFFDKFNLCSTGKKQCSVCANREYIANGMKLSEIFRSVETEMDYFQKVFDRPPEDY